MLSNQNKKFKKTKAFFYPIFFLLPLVLSAQKYTVNGYVSDRLTGEKLIGASIYESTKVYGTTSNLYGFYSLTLPKTDSVTIVFSFVGYAPIIKKVNLTTDIRLDVELQSSIELKTFEVTEKMGEKLEERTQMSTIEVPMKQIEVIPALLGERDILKVIQLLPGVQSGTEGASGIYVRGGGPDQNLILLDGVPVYNASHLFGFFSVFNPDAINHVELTKGGFPARYGGRLSSVLDIRMKEGNIKEWKGAASIGLISSKLTVEGPLWKDKTSLIVSGRRTYIDILAQPIIRAQSRKFGSDVKAGYYFYDLNFKINHKFNENSRLFLSTYLGDDRAYNDIKEKYTWESQTNTSRIKGGLGWGNLTTAARWNQIISKKVFANTTFTYSRFRFEVGEEISDLTETPDTTYSESFKYAYNSGIEDFGAKVDFDILPNPNHYLKLGVGNIYHTFTPGISVFQQNSGVSAGIDTTFGAQKIFAHEISTYAEDDIRLSGRLKVNIGLHFSAFLTQNQTYTSLQPRFSGRFLVTDDLSIKTSYAQMAQFIHLLTNATIGLPTDLWVPSTDKIKPENSHQIAIGAAKTYKNKYEISIEAYYKTMENLIEYKEGASFFTTTNNWDQQVEIGQGEAYGAEFFVQKKEGKTTGWIGYTLSWSNRTFANLNFGNPFPYKFDRRHDISIVLVHHFSENIDFGATWVFGTGNAITLSTERYLGWQQNAEQFFEFYQPTVNYIGRRNDFRMPAYHRLDFGVNMHKQKKRGVRTWSFGVYNSYNRNNPFYLYFEEQANERVLKQVSLFPLIPSISYAFKF